MQALRFRLALWGWRSLSDLIFLVLFRLWPYRRNMVLLNMARCFPTRSEKEIRQMVTAYFRHLADLIVEPFMIGGVARGSLGKLVSYENTALIERLLREKKHIVLMASHYGSWEYLLSLPLQTDCQVLAAYSPVSNKWINSWLLKLRGRFGAVMIPKSEWYRRTLGWNAESSAIFVTIADQRPPESGKYYLNFMNRKTFVQSGAARIAVQRDCAVVYLDVTRRERNAYDFRFRLITAQARELGEAGIMEHYYKALENTIERQPEFWLWSHNRWKFHSRHGQKPVNALGLL
ncbi:lysophospholipid acyltransferase family protein [Dyadobacter fermentans]|uniref:lysophospholipid acyltransferase family protein n=1 Tax=Dyadobacter fermentans TaxID=94254 RepID=UPI001CBB7633|nr:lysophospholipid acyltransferase family protein [Dyadobacter fermentans]MBZ1362105.1 lysophospholipid acyltransferase family protein [Dyadobacter fermentans]